MTTDQAIDHKIQRGTPDYGYLVRVDDGAVYFAPEYLAREAERADGYIEICAVLYQHCDELEV